MSTNTLEQNAWITGKELSHEQVEYFVNRKVDGTGPKSCIHSSEPVLNCNDTTTLVLDEGDLYEYECYILPQQQDDRFIETLMSTWEQEEQSRYESKLQLVNEHTRRVNAQLELLSSMTIREVAELLVTHEDKIDYYHEYFVC